MLKTTKKALLVLLAVMMLFSMTACGKKTDGPAIDGVDLDGDTIISKEPIELTFFHTASKKDDGQWDTLEEAARMTNVRLKVTVSKSNSDYNQAFNLMMASGKLDDIIECYSSASFTQYGVEGAFVAIDEYLDLMPNFKKFLDENPQARKEMTSYDGHIYYIPFMQGGYASTGWFARTDWLEKLGLEAPETAEELHDVLVAFRDKDPNGNGKKDEIPYFNGGMSKTSFGGLECLYPLWNARPSWYAENGKVKFGPYEPAYKDAIKNVAQWYQEGLIDQEIFTRGSNSRAELLGNNVGGMTHDWFGSTAKFNRELEGKIDGFKFEAIPAIEGKEPQHRPATAGYGWGISTQCKHIEEAIKYFDFWFSETGYRLINFGIEGVHYDMVDGKPQFKPELLARDDFQAMITADGVQCEIGYKQDFEYEKQWLHPIAVEGMEMYESHPEWFLDIFPPLNSSYTPEEFERYTELYTPIKTYIDETVSQWLLGVTDVDSTYDAFIKQLESFNVKELIEVQQSAYDRFNK